MNYLRYAVFLLALAVGLTGCYTDFELKVKDPVSHLVLHAFVTADSLVVAEISQSWIAGQSPAPAALPDARVALWLNGQFKEWLQWEIPPSPSDSLLERGIYTSTVRPAAGDSVELKVEAAGFEPVRGADRIPEEGQLENIQISMAGNTSGYQQMKMYITLQDSPGRRNYYGLRVYRGFSYDSTVKPGYASQQVILDYSEEPLFSRTGTIFDDLFTSEEYVPGLVYPFSDEQIDGQRYTLKVSTLVYSQINPSPDREEEYVVCLYSFSEDYYRYVLSLIRQGANSLSDYGLADPALLYHNVTGGIGLVAAYRIDSKTFNPRELLKDSTAVHTK